jgi:hypothetical protein
MSAQPIHQEPDPQDPESILAVLPEQEHEVFLAEIRQAAHAVGDDITAYRFFKKLLRDWSVRARVTRAALERNPNYYEDLEAARREAETNPGGGMPIEEFIAQHKGITLDEATGYWNSKVEEARLARQSGQ